MGESGKQSSAGNGKVGVYICYCGGNISDHVDVEAVRERVARLPEVAKAETNMFMCSDPGQELIMADLQSGRVDQVVIASCAPSLHEMTFRNTMRRAGKNPYVYEHANIREQVSWVHHGENATDKAFRLVSASAAKAALLKPLEPIQVKAEKHVTVIGGGIAGLRSAKDLADKGLQVALIEKTPFLGGRAARLDRLAPTGESASELISELAAQVAVHPGITLYTCASVVDFEGYVGNFKLGIQMAAPDSPDTFCAGDYVPFAGYCPRAIPEGETRTSIKTGAVILATGFKSYTPRQGEYGYGESEAVMTLPDFIELLGKKKSTGRKRLMVDGREIRSIAMVHCVGSRQIPGIHPEEPDGKLNEYCSRTCCASLLNAARQVREMYPETQVYDLHRDIRTYGRGQEDLYRQASENRVVFLRFDVEDPPEIIKGDAMAGYPLQIRVKDMLTFGEEVEVPVDLVVLATGMEPGDVGPLVDMMKLPVGADGFLLEVHPKLRPVELPQTGILLAGTCQAPMDVGEACSVAGSAAAKAAILLESGSVSLDPFVAEVDTVLCTGCGACVEACLVDGAIQLATPEAGESSDAQAQVTPALCTGCGACVAVCPENAVDVNGWTLKQYEAMVDQIVADHASA